MLALPCADCPQNRVLVGKGRASQRTTCFQRQIDASFRSWTHFLDSRTSTVRTNIDVAMVLPVGSEVVCATPTCAFLHSVLSAGIVFGHTRVVVKDIQGHMDCGI